MATSPVASTAIISGLRRAGYEPQLTLALASVFTAEPALGAAFVRVLLTHLDHDDLGRELPSQLQCVAEEVVADGRVDLRFRDPGAWDLIVELKIHAGYGKGWFERYVAALDEVEHAYVAAVTRDIPHYGEPEARSHPRWLGATRWRKLLSGLRELKPSDEALALQWPLFLDVLEREGSMGFTQADPELFDAFARARLATLHMEEFLRALETPLLQALRAALGGADDVASFYWKRGGRFSRTKWGRMDIPFRVPAGGPARVRAGLLGWKAPAAFYVEPNPGHVWVRRRPDARDVVRFLVARGFDREYLRAYLRLEADVVRAADLEERVVGWARDRFGDVVASGILDLPYGGALDEDETEEAMR